MTTSIKSIVFQIAHTIKNRCKSFSQALRTAWIIAKMHFGKTVEFGFRKTDGEYRFATGVETGSLETLERGFVRFKELLDDGTTQWRSFKVGRVL